MPNGKTPKELGYETEDVQWPVLVGSLGFILLFMIITVFALAWMFSARDSLPAMRDVAPMAMAEDRPIPSGPLLQASPPEDLKAYKTDAFHHLESYGWLDEANGKVHMPIERAMEIALEQGFPTGIPAPAAAVEDVPPDESTDEEAR